MTVLAVELLKCNLMQKINRAKVFLNLPCQVNFIRVRNKMCKQWCNFLFFQKMLQMFVQKNNWIHLDSSLSGIV